MAHDAAHDYGEQMSGLLDGALSDPERAALQAHIALCPACQARWQALQQVDLILVRPVQAAPAPGFSARFAARLAAQAVQQRAHVARQRRIATAGMCLAGVLALLILVVPALVSGWQALMGTVQSAPAWTSRGLELAARWLVTLRALGEAGRSIASVMQYAGGPLVMGYALMLALVLVTWVSVLRGASRRWTALPVWVWF